MLCAVLGYYEFVCLLITRQQSSPIIYRPTRLRRDRDVQFLVRDETETETLQGRDRDVFRDIQPSA